MYKLKIEILNNNTEISFRNEVKHFYDANQLESYLNKTFPYHTYKEDLTIEDDFYGASFCIFKGDIAVYSIDIEYVELYAEPENINYAFSEDTRSIYEIFGEDSYLIELEFLKYMGAMREKEVFVDSWRIGKLDSPDSMNEYWTYRTCRGSDDTEIEIAGEKYMFGCNYGH